MLSNDYWRLNFVRPGLPINLNVIPSSEKPGTKTWKNTGTLRNHETWLYQARTFAASHAKHYKFPVWLWKTHQIRLQGFKLTSDIIQGLSKYVTLRSCETTSCAAQGITWTSRQRCCETAQNRCGLSLDRPCHADRLLFFMLCFVFLKTCF